jgi:hypothetical protein
LQKYKSQPWLPKVVKPHKQEFEKFLNYSYIASDFLNEKEQTKKTI